MAFPPPISRLQDLRDRAAGALVDNRAIVWNGSAWTTALLPIAGVNGLQAALDGKQAAGNYAPAAHNHDASAITSGTLDPARIPVLPSSVQIVSIGTIADLTAPQQAEIGDGSVVTTTDGRRWVYTGSGSKTSEASYIELADITPDWGVIANKPSAFTPSAHTHPANQISDSTAAGRAILTAADVAAQRSALGLSAVASSGSASDLGAGTLPAARLPIAAAGSLGGVRVGSGLSIDGSGVLSSSGGGLSAGTATGNTLRWNGTAWVESTVLKNDGTNLTVSGRIDAPTGQMITVRADSSFQIQEMQANLASFILNPQASGANGIVRFERRFASTGNTTTEAGEYQLLSWTGDTYFIAGNNVFGAPAKDLTCRSFRLPSSVVAASLGALSRVVAVRDPSTGNIIGYMPIYASYS